MAIKKFRSGTPPVEIAVELTIMQELDHPNVMPAVAAYFEVSIEVFQSLNTSLLVHFVMGFCYSTQAFI